MDKLKELISRCKCGVIVTVNDHRNIYENLEQWLVDNRVDSGIPMGSEVWQKMIELDTVINVQFYPNTPVGFYDIYHYDLDAALDQALNCFST